MLEVGEWLDCITSVCNVSLSNQLDCWSWFADDKGWFSTVSVQNLLVESVSKPNVFVLDKCSWVPAKCFFLAWRDELNNIQTRDALIRRNIAVEVDSCPFCGNAKGSVDHLFTVCGVSLRVSGDLCSKQQEVVYGLIIIAVWAIWKAINSKIFVDGRGNSEDIVGDVKSLGFLWFKYRLKPKNIVWKECCNTRCICCIPVCVGLPFVWAVCFLMKFT
ncbi:putative reverse transcriptase zinc-binding domain-containing protein [Helianthus anomalus]